MNAEPSGVGVLGTLSAPFTDEYIARIRLFYQKFLTKPARAASVQSDWWNKRCNDVDRRFMCKIAGLPLELAVATAEQLTAGELLALFDAFIRLRQWCDARSLVDLP